MMLTYLKFIIFCYNLISFFLHLPQPSVQFMNFLLHQIHHYFTRNFSFSRGISASDTDQGFCLKDFKLAIFGQILKSFGKSMSNTTISSKHMNKAGRIDMEASMAGSTILPYPAC